MQPVATPRVPSRARQPLTSTALTRTALAWGPMLLCCAALVQPARADESRDLDHLPQTFNRAACYQLASNEGRMIAWARWEKELPEAKMRTGGVREGTPSWMIELIDGWIDDAYHWQATDEQVYQWAKELGNTNNLPHADQLSKHQKIAIWMRRIARQCDKDSV